MALLVLAYPELTGADREWIQSIRSKHDVLYYDIVAPHFTLVFPVADVKLETFKDHVARVADAGASFNFVLRCAVLQKDAFNPYTHVFLAPDEGYSNIVRLHDRLYTGILADELRLDLPFIPHIGIGNDKDPGKCKALADELNAFEPEIQGSVTSVDVVEYQDDVVSKVSAFGLGPPI